MAQMTAHFVEFYSPGTFVSECTTRPVESWDVEAAVAMAHDIVERYGARPFGFRFITRERADDELDSKITKRSGTYYLGGRIETLADVEARNDQNEHTLRTNMRMNKIDRIVVNDNSWRSTMPFEDGDTLLDVMLRPQAKEGSG